MLQNLLVFTEQIDFDNFYSSYAFMEEVFIVHFLNYINSEALQGSHFYSYNNWILIFL